MSPSCLKLLLTLTLVFIICECAPQGRPGKARAKGGVKECTDDSDCDEGFNCIFGKKINKHICARLGLKGGKGPKEPKGPKGQKQKWPRHQKNGKEKENEDDPKAEPSDETEKEDEVPTEDFKPELAVDTHDVVDDYDETKDDSEKTEGPAEEDGDDIAENEVSDDSQTGAPKTGTGQPDTESVEEGSGDMEGEEGEAEEGEDMEEESEEDEDRGNGKDKQGSLEVFNKGRSRGRDYKIRRYPKTWPPRPRDPCDRKIEAILKKVMKKLEMSQLIENKALKMVTEMMDEHGYGYMDDEDDMDFQVFSPPKDVRLRRKGFASKYSEEEEQDMDDVANEAMDSEDDDQNDATTADPSDLNAEAPDDDYEADPVEVGTETNSMDEPIDEPIDEDDISETGGSAEMEDYDAITPAYEPEE